jgi:integrase
LCGRALPYIGELPVKQITKAHIFAMVRALENTRLRAWRDHQGGSLSEASAVLRHLRSCFRWAAAVDLVDRDPTFGIPDPLTKKGERERVLSDVEIKALWRVCEQIGYPYGRRIVQLLLLTGQRVHEVGDLTWGEIDLGKRVWSLPSNRAKNHRPHDIHLSDLAMEIISPLPRFTDSDFPVFA